MIHRFIFLFSIFYVVWVTGFVIPERFNEIDDIEKVDNGITENTLNGDDPEIKRERVRRQLTKIHRKWPDAKVYYSFDFFFGSKQREMVVAAMNEISSQTCIKFEEKVLVLNSIRFLNINRCASSLGMNGGMQFLYLSPQCSLIGASAHELMHALGIFHTHSRYDRDEFLNLNLSPVPFHVLHNFVKETPLSTFHAAPFEYGSAMTYSTTVFSSGYMLPKDMSYERTMGSLRPTFYDILNINALYSCKCPIALKCTNGGYTNPSNCSKCVCPDGFGGKLCDGIPPNSVQLNSSLQWKQYSISFGSDDNMPLSTNFVFKHVIIRAPVDKTIQVRLIKMTGFDCFNGCLINGIEMKLMGDPRITNPLYCCDDDFSVINKIFTSKQNPLPINMFTRRGKSNLTIQYRFINEQLSKRNKTDNGYDNYKYYL